MTVLVVTTCLTIPRGPAETGVLHPVPTAAAVAAATASMPALRGGACDPTRSSDSHSRGDMVAEKGEYSG